MNLDLTSIASTVLGSGALDGIISKTGSSKNDVSSVLSEALPLLIQGAGKQSSGSNANGFAQALEQHASNSTSNLSSFFKNVDIEDGAKIVSHLLGSNTSDIAKQIAKKLNIDGKQVSTIISTAAPLLMSLLGKKATEAKDSKTSTASIAQALLGSVDVNSILKGFLK